MDEVLDCETSEVVPIQGEPQALERVNDVINNANNVVSNANNVVSSVDGVVNSVNNVVSKFAEIAEHKTRRVEIQAQRDVELEKVKAQSKIQSDAINNEFKERAGNFEKLHEWGDKALENHNTEQLGMVLDTMCNMAENSVIKKIASGVKQNPPEKISLNKKKSLDI